MSKEEINENYIFTWRIKNYSCCFQTKGTFIESPNFSIENQKSGKVTQWCLWFYPKGRNSEPSVSFFLRCKNSEEINGNFPVTYNLEILDVMGKVLRHKAVFDREFTKTSNNWGYNDFMVIDELQKEMDGWEDDILTLRCHIKHKNLNKQDIFGSEACTVINVKDRRFFDWNLNILKVMRSESIVFPFSDAYDFEITLKLLLEDLQLLFHLKRNLPNSSLPVFFSIRVSICNEQGFKIISKRAKHLFQGEETWIFPHLIRNQLLESCCFDSVNYKFNLKFELAASDKKMSSFIEKLSFYSVCSPIASIPSNCNVLDLQNDFKSLFIHKKYSDVTIRAGNEEFQAHKLVLRVRSPVFEAMFEQNMLESETGVVNVTDVSGDTIKAFLQFLYTGDVEITDCANAQKLLLVADKYQVPSLVKKCASFLTSNLSVENACEIIAVADTVNCEYLKSFVFDFIISNANTILMNADWELWIKGNIELASKILFRLSTDLIR